MTPHPSLQHWHAFFQGQVPSVTFDPALPWLRWIQAQAKPLNLDLLHFIQQAFEDNKRLYLRYYNRREHSVSERVVSPQQLVFYKNGWYLEAFCHERNGLRTFASEAILSADLHTRDKDTIDPKMLEDYMALSYGIMVGDKTDLADITIQGQLALLLKTLVWHPAQTQQQDESKGQLHIQFPFANSQELVRDLACYADGLIINHPASLKQAYKQHLLQGLQLNL